MIENSEILKILKNSERAIRKRKIRDNRRGKNGKKCFIYRHLSPKFYVWDLGENRKNRVKKGTF